MNDALFCFWDSLSIAFIFLLALLEYIHSIIQTSLAGCAFLLQLLPAAVTFCCSSPNLSLPTLNGGKLRALQRYTSSVVPATMPPVERLHETSFVTHSLLKTFICYLCLLSLSFLSTKNFLSIQQ